jgi:hypothetical protein
MKLQRMRRFMGVGLSMIEVREPQMNADEHRLMTAPVKYLAHLTVEK